MSTGTAVLIIGGVGLAAVGFLYIRSRNQQAAMAAAAAAPASSGGGGGGIAGLGQRVLGQWLQDPLGIQNTKAVASAGVGVVKAGAKELISLPGDIIGGIRSIF